MSMFQENSWFDLIHFLKTIRGTITGGIVAILLASKVFFHSMSPPIQYIFHK
jgi:hypothetical protein